MAKKDSNNTTEIVYITERVSMMQCDRGRFIKAQASLRVASEILMEALKHQEQDLEKLNGSYNKSNRKNKLKNLQKSKKKSKGTGDKKEDGLVRMTSYKLDENAGVMHSHFFTLRTKLAQVFLAKEQLPDAINLLQKVQLNLKNGKRDKKMEVSMLLVRCFLRLRDFDECERELDSIQDELRGSLSNSRISTSPNSNISGVSGVSGMHSVSGVSSMNLPSNRGSPPSKRASSSASGRRPQYENENNRTRLNRVRSIIESLEEDKNRNSKMKPKHQHHRRGAARMESVSIPKFDRGIERIVRSVEYLKLRARNLAYGNHCRLALGWLNLALSVVRPSSLGGLGSLHYLRGKIYQRSNYQHVDGLRLCGIKGEGGEEQYQYDKYDTEADIEDIEDQELYYDELNEKEKLNSFSSSSNRSISHEKSIDMYIRGVGAFQRASQYFRAVDDHYRQAKALVRESALHLHQLYIPIQIQNRSLTNVTNTLMSDLQQRATKSSANSSAKATLRQASKEMTYRRNSVNNHRASMKDVLKADNDTQEGKEKQEKEEKQGKEDKEGKEGQEQKEDGNDTNKQNETKEKMNKNHDSYTWVHSLLAQRSVGTDGTTNASALLLNAIEQPVNLAIDLASNVSDPMLMLQCLHTISELRCLQGYDEPSQAYFEEAYLILTRIFLVDRMDTNNTDKQDNNNTEQQQQPSSTSTNTNSNTMRHNNKKNNKSSNKSSSNNNNNHYSQQELPSIPSTCGDLPAGLINKLHTASESLIAILLGLGGTLLNQHASLFLAWNLLDTQKWCSESRLPKIEYAPLYNTEELFNPSSSSNNGTFKIAKIEI